jgi:hypothetical protein
MRACDRWIDSFIRRVCDNSRTRVCAIGPVVDPIMHRYFVVPRNRFFNIYLHNIHRSDEGGLHDHRMANITIVLQGHYYDQRFETTPVVGKPLPRTVLRLVEPLRPVFRRAAMPHRVILEHSRGESRAFWSLFIGLPHVRNWGFWMEHEGKARWVPHEEPDVF